MLMIAVREFSLVATTSFGSSADAYDLLTFTLSGNGIVRGVLRLAFKASALACGGVSSTSDLLGGDAAGLAYANTAGDIAYICGLDVASLPFDEYGIHAKMRSSMFWQVSG